MEISAPNRNILYGRLDNFTSNPPSQINYPLHRPQYKPPNPTRIQPSSDRPRRRKPVTIPADVLRLMDSLKLPIPLDLYTSLVKECTELGDPLKAVELHQHIRRSGLRPDLPLLNTVLLMCVSCGCFGHARQLFDQMFVRDFNSWAVVIAGCVENGECSEAVKLFVRMLGEVEFEKFSDHGVEFIVAGIVVCVLRACLCASNIKFGLQVHAWLWKMGYARNAVLSSFLISFYGKLNLFCDAESVFEQGHDQNTAVWTSRIVNFCSDGDYKGVIRVFNEMGREGVRRNGYTFSTVLKACGRAKDVGCGRQIHASVVKLGLESNSFVQCGLVDLYGKCGYLNDSSRVFEIGEERKNIACCNAMLASYVQHGLCIDAVRILYKMKMVGFLPRESVFNELRSICGSGVRVEKDK